MTRQISFFDGNKPYKINKPIRLIELFGGYGSQHFALEYLGANFQQWKLCEWAVKSIQAYKDAHFKDDNTDYSKDLSKEELIEYLANKGISANYNEPMTKEQVKRLGEDKLRTIYNNIMATHNLVNIQQVKGEDLEIVDTDKYEYIITYSFPCQDLSKAGLGKGMEKGSGTRSGLLWEVERVLDELNEMGKDKLPKVLLMENVPDVIGTTAIKDFAKWLAKLESLGYKCYWNILNAKNLGIPQNRERCFMVSILGDYFYSFPKIIPLTYKLVDVLEKNVDEKFYLSDKMLEYCTDMKNRNGFVRGEAFKPIDAESQNYARTITTMSGQRPTDNFIKVKDGKYPIIKDCENYIEWHQKGLLDMETRAWKDDKISPTIHTNSGKIKILENQNLKSKLCNQLVASGQVQEGDVIRHSYSSSRMNNFYPSNRENKDCSPTLDTRCDCLGIVTKQDVIGTYQYANSDNFMRGRKRFRENKEISDTLQTQPKEGVVYAEYRIRKLTPKECFRLMGIKDEDFEKVAKNQSNASLYHLAGDSIVVAVLVAIFGQMLDNFDFNEYIEEFYKEIEYINKEYDEDECLIFRYDLKQKLEEMKEV
jgi:DNA (cytosine-5)-methyltransferase 1